MVIRFEKVCQFLKKLNTYGTIPCSVLGISAREVKAYTPTTPSTRTLAAARSGITGNEPKASRVLPHPPTDTTGEGERESVTDTGRCRGGQRLRPVRDKKARSVGSC